MKNISVIVALLVFTSVKAQVVASSDVTGSINGENAFLDASGYSDTSNWGQSVARGLIFPQVDLTQFRFKTDMVTDSNFPTAFDGMIVYNIGTGTISDPKLTTTQEPVEPGFYYFHNPTGKSILESPVPPNTGDDAVAPGKWIPLGSGGGSATIKTTETRLGKIDNVQLYGIKGTFQVTAADGATINNFLPNALVSPTPITSIHSIKIYDSTKKLVTSSLVSYDIANNKAVTGMGNMSIPLPVGTYSYVLEYFK